MFASKIYSQHCAKSRKKCTSFPHWRFKCIIKMLKMYLSTWRLSVNLSPELLQVFCCIQRTTDRSVHGSTWTDVEGNVIFMTLCLQHASQNAIRLHRAARVDDGVLICSHHREICRLHMNDTLFWSLVRPAANLHADETEIREEMR